MDVDLKIWQLENWHNHERWSRMTIGKLSTRKKVPASEHIGDSVQHLPVSAAMITWRDHADIKDGDIYSQELFATNISWDAEQYAFPLHGLK